MIYLSIVKKNISHQYGILYFFFQHYQRIGYLPHFRSIFKSVFGQCPKDSTTSHSNLSDMN